MLTTKRTLPAFALVTLMVIGSCSSDDDDDTSALGETGSLPDETSTVIWQRLLVLPVKSGAPT